MSSSLALANNSSTIHADVVIIGAGASGLYCAMVAGQRGKKVIVIDHASKVGLKILMSGGGRCNFTNYYVSDEHFISVNQHFCKSALTRYSCWDFISLVEKHQIAYHERGYSQLFCQNHAKDIVTMLLAECEKAKVQIISKTHVNDIQKSPDGFTIQTQKVSKHSKEELQSTTQAIDCRSLVIATGGLSVPNKGATGFGYQVATQFGHDIIPTSAGLVPFTFTDKLGEMFASLSGISLDVIAFNDRISFARPLLFTHRGLSGFAMLQLSNYWQMGESIHINLLPTINACELLLEAKSNHAKQKIQTVFSSHLPKKLLLALQEYFWQAEKDIELANIKDSRLIEIGQQLNDWQIKPSGTEGYRTAEVTLGGVATDHISSKTFESTLQPNLYFIGEVLDVTGWLGGYNFQWAWASGYACGQSV